MSAAQMRIDLFPDLPRSELCWHDGIVQQNWLDCTQRWCRRIPTGPNS